MPRTSRPSVADNNGGGGVAAPAGIERPAVFLALALLLSAGLLWIAAADAILLGAYLAALVGFGAIFLYFRLAYRQEPAAENLPPDWSVTRAAAQLSDAAVAISDRAGRLVCANEIYGIWFETLQAPPDIEVDEAGRQILVKMARTAWRDGETAPQDIVGSDAMEYSARATRAGVGDEYLVWWFTPKARRNVESAVQEIVSGPVGHAMAISGVMSICIGPGGRIRAANNAFALRATGDENAGLSGQEFGQFLRMDEKGRIFFEREGRRGLPIRLIHVPLGDVGKNDPEQGASLLFAVDEDGAQIDRAAALSHVEHLLSTLPLGLALINQDGLFIFANEAFARTVDMAADKLPPYPGDLVIPEDKAAVAESIRRYATGAPMSGDIAVRLKERPDEVIALSIAGVRGLGDAAVLIGLKDNSEETKLKRQIAQATKMQAVGQLAGGVAHDFNNILTAIIGYCDLMLLRHQPGDSDYDDIQQIKNNSNRAAGLTRQLLAFSRQQTLRPQILQLPDVVAEVSHLLKRLLGEQVKLEVRHGRGLGMVRADPGQLEQVIINLGVNARDAMPKGGTLHIETKAVSAGDVRAMRSEILPIADYVLLSISDTGTGISKEHLGKIFEPFFTTKEVGKGTGLGLSTVYGIVKQSGGFIFADSQMGKGTRFDIYLPVHEGKVAAERSGRKEMQKSADLWGSGRILIVEDEDMVRAVAERALVRQGYEVVTARDGEEGLNRYADGGPFNLVISDVVMPNMDGPAMARQLRIEHGNVKIMFMSGYAEEQLRQSIDLDNMFFLPKPFSVQQIAEAVKEAMESNI